MSTVSEVRPAAEEISARRNLVRWWGETLATLEQIADTALELAKHADHEDSPLYGCIDGGDLYSFYGRLGDLTMSLYNNEPVPSHDALDPTEDLPELPKRPERKAAEAVDPSVEAAQSLNEDTARRVAKLTDEERRELIAKTVPSVDMSAAQSDILPAIFALMVEFTKRYYPTADHASFFVSYPDHRPSNHMSIWLADEQKKGGAAWPA